MERQVAAAPQEVIQAEPQSLKGHADMASVVKPLLQAHAVVLAGQIILL